MAECNSLIDLLPERQRAAVPFYTTEFSKPFTLLDFIRTTARQTCTMHLPNDKNLSQHSWISLNFRLKYKMLSKLFLAVKCIWLEDSNVRITLP